MSCHVQQGIRARAPDKHSAVAAAFLQNQETKKKAETSQKYPETEKNWQKNECFRLKEVGHLNLAGRGTSKNGCNKKIDYKVIIIFIAKYLLD